MSRGESELKHLMLVVLLSACFSASAKDEVAKATISDEQVKQQIIQESIDSYPGNCLPMPLQPRKKREPLRQAQCVESSRWLCADLLQGRDNG